MSNFDKARKDIKFWASAMKGLMALDEELGEVGTIEKARDAAQNELKLTVAAIEGAQKRIAQSNKDAEAIVAGAHQTAKEIKADVQRIKEQSDRDEKAAADRVAQADAEADRLIALGKQNAARAALDADGLLGGLNKKIDHARSVLTARESEIELLTSRRDSIRADLDSLGAKLKSFS